MTSTTGRRRDRVSGRIALRATTLLSAHTSGRTPTAEIRVGAKTRARMPALGIELGSGAAPASDEPRRGTRSDAFLSLGVATNADDLAARVARWSDYATRAGLGLQATLEMADGGSTPSAIVAAAADPALRRLVLVGPDLGPPQTALASRVNALLGTKRSSLEVAVGTRGPFASVNRTWSTLTPFTSIAFPLSPQYHADDDLSIVECAEALPDVIRTARRSGGMRAVHVSPLSMSLPTAYTRGDAPDPREAGPFGAAYTLACAAALAWSGVSSLAFHAPGQPDLAGDLVHELASAYALQAALLGLPRASLVGLEATGDAAVAGLAVAAGPVTHLVIANLTKHAARATVAGLGAVSMSGSRLRGRGGVVRLDLDPYQVTWLEGRAA